MISKKKKFIYNFNKSNTFNYFPNLINITPPSFDFTYS
ncbi:MAG: hypothetical protein KatS3mg095_0726 [Candidatus Parcubacteria bacterium]|nr:MAG: hypothetical protein KatS3mg095_0726 [Candidatus Parcubacteria bacterium]